MMSRSQCCLHTARDLEELSVVGAAWRAAAGNEVTFIGLRERSASEVKRVKREGGGIRLPSGLGYLGTSVSVRLSVRNGRVLLISAILSLLPKS